jgi:hypothetical protein
VGPQLGQRHRVCGRHSRRGPGLVTHHEQPSGFLDPREERDAGQLLVEQALGGGRVPQISVRGGQA